MPATFRAQFHFRSRTALSASSCAGVSEFGPSRSPGIARLGRQEPAPIIHPFPPKAAPAAPAVREPAYRHHVTHARRQDNRQLSLLSREHAIRSPTLGSRRAASAAPACGYQASLHDWYAILNFGY